MIRKKFVTEYGIPYLYQNDPSKKTCKKYAGLILLNYQNAPSSGLTKIV